MAILPSCDILVQRSGRVLVSMGKEWSLVGFGSCHGMSMGRVFCTE